MKNNISQIFDLGNFVPEIFKIHIEKFSKIMALLNFECSPWYSWICLTKTLSSMEERKKVMSAFAFWSYVSQICVNIFERFLEKYESKNKDMFREILKTASTTLWSTNYIFKTLSNTPLANLLGNFQKLSKYQHLLFSWSNKKWQANYNYKH